MVPMNSVHGNLEGVKSIPAGEFKQRCLALLDEVEASGEPIVVTKRNRPVAQVAPIGPDAGEDWRGAMRTRGEITGDLVAPAAGVEEWEAVRG